MDYKITHLKPFGVLIEPQEKNVAISDLDIESLRQIFYQEQLLLLRGFETFQDKEDFSGYCERWGTVALWPFGKVLELLEQDNPEDHIFDYNYVPLHWDGMYRPEVPEYQIFHCVKAPLTHQGGETTFSHTMLALENTSDELKKIWQKVTGSYQRKMEFYHSKVVSPIITKHPRNNLSVIRYNEPPSPEKGDFINPPDLDFLGLGVGEEEKFHFLLQEVLYSPQNFYSHKWQTGDVVIADNFSLLHGREKFVSKAPRHLQRVHVLGNPPFKNPGLEFYK